MNSTIHGPVVIDTNIHVDDSPELSFGLVAFSEEENPDSGYVQMFFASPKQLNAVIKELQDLAQKMADAYPKCSVVEIKP